ncbi:MAG: protein jag [Clostridia bacterium]|nr:protein jag [Clostridia bacterium]
MKSIEMTGKTVKEAINKGVEALGCSITDVDTKILEMGSPGLFGIFGKPAKVLLTLKEKDSGIEMPVFSLDQKPAKQNAPKKKAEPVADVTKVEEPAVEEEAETEADAADEKTEQPRKRRSRNRRKKSSQPKPETVETAETEAPEVVVEAEPFEPTAEEDLSETAKNARAFLAGLTEKMNVPAEIAVQESEEQLKMVLTGENMSILIGRRGETLDAIQYLTSLNVNHGREDYLRVTLDTENYRAKREEALRKLAHRMANRCKKNGRRVALEPMNPYERRILHSALQADPDVTTHSEGEEPYRRVIITLK